jgi:hypothetical protein
MPSSEEIKNAFTELNEDLALQLVKDALAAKILGGHLKSGHAWTSQNRPWRVA